jgi:hypothetical protein
MRKTIASQNTLENIIYQLFDKNQITFGNCSDLITAVKNTPSENIY